MRKISISFQLIDQFEKHIWFFQCLLLRIINILILGSSLHLNNTRLVFLRLLGLSSFILLLLGFRIILLFRRLFLYSWTHWWQAYLQFLQSLLIWNSNLYSIMLFLQRFLNDIFILTRIVMILEYVSFFRLHILTSGLCLL